MNQLARDSLKLKAAIEFGSEYIYTVKNGGLGPTLLVDAETKAAATLARKKIPSTWEGLYVVVIYSQHSGDEEYLEGLCDPELV